MKLRRHFIALGILLGAAAVMMVAFKAGGPETAGPDRRETTIPKAGRSQPQPAPPAASGAPVAGGTAVTTTGLTASPDTGARAVDTPPPPTSKEAIQAAIHEASITYDAKELPKIQPHLLHPDPEIREAALNGMLVLGDAAAAPLLRAAAKQLESPREAAKLLEAADYLELPSGSLRMATKRPAKPRSPPLPRR